MHGGHRVAHEVPYPTIEFIAGAIPMDQRKAVQVTFTVKGHTFKAHHGMEG
jgi:hypothetical protein